MVMAGKLAVLPAVGMAMRIAFDEVEPEKIEHAEPLPQCSRLTLVQPIVVGQRPQVEQLREVGPRKQTAQQHP